MEATAVDAGLPASTDDAARREALFRALDAVVQVAAPGQLRAVAYLRVSTEDQKKGYGVTYTGKRVVRHIAKKGWALVNIFADEGYSGTLDHTKRPDLKNLMEQARQVPRPFDVVDVQEARAIGREGEAFWPWVWELKKLGIFVAVSKKDYDNTTDHGRSQMRKDQDAAEDERILIRDRTQGGIQEKAEIMASEGAYLGGNVPYGYRIENKGETGESRLAPDECDCPGECAGLHEAGGVRLAAARFAATLSYETTGNEMNRAGYRRKSGALWDYGSVYNLLHTRATLEAVMVHRGSKDATLDADGKPEFGARVEIQLKPILTPEELALLAEAKAKRPPRRSPKTFTYTLAGRVKSPCGLIYGARGMSRQGDKHGRSPFKGLQCQGNRSAVPKAKRCKCPIIWAEPIERESWRLVKEFLQDPEELERLATEAIQAQRETGADFDAELKKLGKRIAELEESIDLMLMAATQQVAARRLPRAEAEKYIAKMTAQPNADLADLQKRQIDIQRWKENAANADSTAKQLRTLAERAKTRLENKTLEEQAELFNLLQAEVEIAGKAPARPLGRTCKAVAFFAERGLMVPDLTDEAWSKVADVVPVLSPRHPSRDILAGFLEKARTGAAWTALDVGVPHTTLMNHWIRWGACGGLEAVMERLAGMPGTPPPDYSAVTVRVRCTILPEVLLVDADLDGNDALSVSVGSNAGSRAPFTISVLLAA